MKKFLLLAVMMMANISYAAVYVNETPSGGIEYTDTPGTNASKVTIPETNSITTPKVEPAAPVNTPTPNTGPAGAPADPSLAQAPSSSNADYTKFEIVAPKDQETIQNQPVIPVELASTPNIKSGDKIQVMLDNQPAGPATGNIYHELGLVERGTHTIYAVITNSQNQIIKKSSTITIFVHRNSSNTSPAMQRAPQGN